MDVIEKKEIVREDNHDYASKGVAGSALGLGIAGTALALLNGNGLFGWGKARNEDMYLERKECQDYVDLTKEFYAGRIQYIRDSADVFIIWSQNLIVLLLDYINLKGIIMMY